jgi:hypothetical protein
MTIDTNIVYSDKDVNKNLYRKKTYYTLVVEQEVLAKDKDEADQKFLDDGGIDHSQINHEITTAKNGVETYMVDANYTESGNTEYMGKVLYDLSDPHAKEEGYVEIDTYADEVMPDVVDTMIQLEADLARGK